MWSYADTTNHYATGASPCDGTGESPYQCVRRYHIVKS